jgi:hypothetical protein
LPARILCWLNMQAATNTIVVRNKIHYASTITNYQLPGPGLVVLLEMYV